jgi:hypothetical protein
MASAIECLKKAARFSRAASDAFEEAAKDLENML